LQNGTRAYERLCQIFRRADERYNSGLFHFSAEKERPDPPDDLTLNLTIDDKVLKEIFKGLYYPESPFEFSVLPADILGHIYEQFLGKVIRLTPGHHAKVEDKPEVKKAGGVYYTPTYIVDYIVKNTVGNLLERNTPTKVAKTRVLDPACGSGSFLLGAYQYLLDWHQEWYANHDPEKHAKGRSPKVYRTISPSPHGRGQGEGAWRLTTAEKKRILLNNIYGVDIDTQAVEVTKLSLLLKVLEGENAETLGKSLRLFHERALPDLGENIKCGNSLIGPDFYEGKQLSLLDDEERYRINAFDWNAEFPEIMQAGGFDAVIGNPPYIRMEEFKEIKHYLKMQYVSYEERADLYVYFIERAHTLLRPRGYYGMILSNKFVKAKYGCRLRAFLATSAKVESIVDFAGLPVFQGATVRTIVLNTQRAAPDSANRAGPVYLPPVSAETFAKIAGESQPVSSVVRSDGRRLSPSALRNADWLFVEEAAHDVLSKLKLTSAPLGDVINNQVLWGVKTGLNDAFVIDESARSRLIERDPKSAEAIKPFLAGQDVRRYHLRFSRRYLIYTYHGFDLPQFPAIEEHLRPFRERLQQRATKQNWWELQQPSIALVPVFKSRKIVFPEIAPECRFTLDDAGYFCNNKTFVLPSEDPYLLALLNSRVGLFFFTLLCAALESSRGKYLEFRAQYVRQFPIHLTDFSDKSDAARHNKIVALVKRMLALHKQLAEAKTNHEKTAIQRQIDSTDKQIDQLVYELYGLTDKEIRIVEEGTK
jgi:hypothetical protein